MLYIKSIDPLLSISRYYKDCGHFANADIHWFGECAKHFGLTGDVNKELLKILLAGKLPSEKRVVKNYNFQENLLGGIGYELMFV